MQLSTIIQKRKEPRMKKLFLKKQFPSDSDTPEHIRLPKKTQIREIVNESKCVKTFFFEYAEIAKVARPGQFVMVGVFNGLEDGDGEEIPLSLSYILPERGLVGVTVKKAGRTTEALLRYEDRAYLTVRGPYGNGFREIGGRVAIVGGGVGIVSLAPLIEKLTNENVDVTVFLGAKTRDDVIFVDRLKKAKAELVITTEDGSFGKQGMVVEALHKSLANGGYDQIVTCGRELMMKEVLELADKSGIPCQLSLERYIKCGRGICGHCAIDGYLVCKDGPVFSSEIVRNMKDFGKRQLDDSGATVELTF